MRALARLRVEHGVVDDHRPLAERERRLDGADLRLGLRPRTCAIVEKGVGLARVLEFVDVGVDDAGGRALRIASYAG